MIRVFQPSVGAWELSAIQDVFARSWLGRGFRAEAFEIAFAKHLGVPADQLIATNSCTTALFAAQKTVVRGNYGVMPSIHFVGAANAVMAAGARPVFCDVDPRTLNATAEHFEAALTGGVCSLLLLHYGGVPCDLDGIMALSEQTVWVDSVIEDCAGAIASKHRGQACGTFGDAATWSFDAMKTLTCGDGGMLRIKDPRSYKAARDRLWFGLDRASGSSANGGDGWWKFDVGCAGGLGLMNDVAASMGVVQLKRLPELLRKRWEVVEAYNDAFGELGWLMTPPETPDYVETTPYFYWLQTERRDELARWLYDRGVYTTFRYYPLHRVKFYGYDGPELPGADEAARTTLLLPLHAALSDDDVDKVCDLVINFGLEENL